MITQLPGEIGGVACMTINGRELHEAIRFSIGSYLGFIEERIEALGLIEDGDYAVKIDDITVDYIFTVEAASRILKPLGDPVEVLPQPEPAKPAKARKTTTKPGEIAAVVSKLSGRKVEPRQLEMVF